MDDLVEDMELVANMKAALRLLTTQVQAFERRIAARAAIAQAPGLPEGFGTWADSMATRDRSAQFEAFGSSDDSAPVDEDLRSKVFGA